MRKLLAVPFGLVCGVLLLASVTALTLRSFALEPEFYRAALRDRGAFQNFERDPLSLIDLNSQFAQLDALPPDTQRQVIRAALPAGWLEQALTTAVRDLLTWLASDEAGAPSISIDLRPIKDRLQGPPGTEIAREVVAAIPTCADGQAFEFSFTQLPDCLPAALDRSLVIDQVAAGLDSAGGTLPVSIDLGVQLIRGPAQAALMDVRRALQPVTSEVLLAALVAATLGVWIVGALIGGRTGRERWLWLGGWLMFGALLTVAVYAGVLVAGSRAVLLSDALTLPAPLTPLAGEIVRGAAAHVVQQLALRSMIPAAGLIIAGVGLAAVGWSKSPDA